MKLTENDEMFQGPDGRSILMVTDPESSNRRRTFISDDGKTFYQVYEMFSGCSGEKGSERYELDIVFEDIHHNTKGKIHRKYNSLWLDNYQCSSVACPENVTAVLLPVFRKAEYLYQLPDSRLIYVSADKYNYIYRSFQLFIGAAGSMMKQLPISWTDEETGVDRDFDATCIQTAVGSLYATSFRESFLKARWIEPKSANVRVDARQGIGAALTKLDPKDFNITETAEGATITPKG